MPLAYQPPLSLTTDFAGLLDGNFDFWDVATSIALTAADKYTADMWIGNAGTGGAATVTQNIPLIGSEQPWTTTPRKYRYQHQQTTAASTNPTIGQKIPSVLNYNGDTISLSGTFSSVTANAITGVKITQNFGTGGSPSASVVTTVNVNWSLSASESFQSVQITVPNVSGKTLGTNGDDYIRFDLLLATGSTYTVTASQIFVDENGTQVFRYRGIEIERLRIESYVFLIGSINSPLGFINGFNNGGGSAVAFLPLPVLMRVSPAATIIGGSITSNGYTSAGGLVAGTSAATIGALSKNAIQFSGSNSGGNWGIGLANYFAAGSPSSLIVLDARP